LAKPVPAGRHKEQAHDDNTGHWRPRGLHRCAHPCGRWPADGWDECVRLRVASL